MSIALSNKFTKNQKNALKFGIQFLNNSLKKKSTKNLKFSKISRWQKKVSLKTEWDRRLTAASPTPSSRLVSQASKTRDFLLHQTLDRISQWEKINLSGVGLTLGGVFSLFFFKRRMWPLYGGAFFGLGVAYNNCEKALNNNWKIPCLGSRGYKFTLNYVAIKTWSETRWPNTQMHHE